MYKMTTALVLGIALTGCASMKPSVHTESTFVIYDVKPAMNRPGFRRGSVV